MRSKHFVPEEFHCACCGREAMQQAFIDRLDEAREYAGIPFVITSGYRCPAHNAVVGGKPASAHTSGWAADISVPSSGARWRIAYGLYMAGFERIGIAEAFIHCDMAPDLPKKVLWTY